MLLLLDECVPRPLKRDLIGYEIGRTHGDRNGASDEARAQWRPPKRGAGGNRRGAAAPSAKKNDPGGDRTHDPVIKSHMLYH